MSRLVLVDAYNVVWRLFGDARGDLDEARRRLVERARDAARRARVPGGVDRVHLIFDTHPGSALKGRRGRAGRVSWHYVAGSADDAILEHLRRHEGRPVGPRVIVITNDRELAGRARQLGARTMGVDDFFVPPDVQPPTSWPPVRLDGPPFTARDFGLPEGEIDLTDPDADLDSIP